MNDPDVKFSASAIFYAYVSPNTSTYNADVESAVLYWYSIDQPLGRLKYGTPFASLCFCSTDAPYTEPIISTAATVVVLPELNGTFSTNTWYETVPSLSHIVTVCADAADVLTIDIP
jgi:hypothetical protein